MRGKNLIIQEKIKKSLNLSIKEGSYASVMYGSGSSYLAPYAIALNASSSQIGLLNAFSNLLPSIAQLRASRLIEKFSRKIIVNISVMLQNFMFIPIILTALLFINNSPYTIWILIGLITLFHIFGAYAGPAWFSWMGSLVPENERGKYFAKRNKVTGFFGLLAAVFGALILDKFKKSGKVLIGFGILFSISFLFRAVSIRLLSRQYEPKIKIKKEDYFSFWQFLAKARDTPFGRFTFFTSIIRIAMNIAGPFFAVYMLKSLGFSYILFIAITVSASVFQLLFFPLIGRISDRFGNIQLLKFSSLLIAVIPLLWIVSANPVYLIFIPQIVSGFGWAGFTIATNNYIYDSVRQEKQGLGVAYYNLLNGIGLFIGAGIGSFLVLININFMNIILFIFLVSGILSLALAVGFSKILKEVRPVKKFSPLFVINEFHPAKGLIKQFHSMENKFGKIENFM